MEIAGSLITITSRDRERQIALAKEVLSLTKGYSIIILVGFKYSAITEEFDSRFSEDFATCFYYTHLSLNQSQVAVLRTLLFFQVFFHNPFVETTSG